MAALRERLVESVPAASSINTRHMDPVLASASSGSTKIPTLEQRMTNIKRIHRKGGGLHAQDVYFYLLASSWPVLVIVWISYYAVLSMLVASLLAIVPGNLVRGNGELVEDWASHLYIAAGMLADVDVSVEAEGAAIQAVYLLVGLLKLLSLSLMIALLVDRVTHAHSRLIFSDSILLEYRNGVPHLTFRVACERPGILFDMKATLILMQGYKTKEGTAGRKLVELELVKSEVPMMALAFTFMHVIDEHSPVLPYVRAWGGGADAELGSTAYEPPPPFEAFAFIKVHDPTHRESLRAWKCYDDAIVTKSGHWEDTVAVNKHGTGIVLDLRNLSKIKP